MAKKKAVDLSKDAHLSELVRELYGLDRALEPMQARREAIAAEIKKKVLKVFPEGHWWSVGNLRPYVRVSHIYKGDESFLRGALGRMWRKIARRKVVYVLDRATHEQLVKEGKLPEDSVEETSDHRVAVYVRDTEEGKKRKK